MSSDTSTSSTPTTSTSSEEKAMDADDFFSTNTAPSNLKQVEDLVASFVSTHQKASRPVCVVTSGSYLVLSCPCSEGFFVKVTLCCLSGGTTVPLEKNTVRFIDNFRCVFLLYFSLFVNPIAH
jgi:hypothetical protein